MDVTAYPMAEAGWLVEVILPTVGSEPDSRFFAVGVESGDEAEKAVLAFPGLLTSDTRIARRRLSPMELSSLKLRLQAVRPYSLEIEE
jgi:hypothetical protein